MHNKFKANTKGGVDNKHEQVKNNEGNSKMYKYMDSVCIE